MTTVLDDVTSQSIDAPYIQRRVDDWTHRVDALYSAVTEALPEGWSCTEADTVPMHEELMRKFNVPPTSMPTLSLRHESRGVASLVPRGLWVIGANGRLDLSFNGERYIVIDVADSFTAPQWQVCLAGDRRHREPFTSDWLRHVLQ